jgi:uncharacterized protein involved in type VI secretion and phage assembly
MTGNAVPAQVQDEKKVVRKAIKRPFKTTALRRDKKRTRRVNPLKRVNRKTADPKQDIPASTKKTQIDNQTTDNNAPSESEIKRAGEFKGDLRDIPPTKPIRQDRPKLADPKVDPKPYVKPIVRKPDA